MNEPLVVNSSVVIPARDMRWTAVRASGPGGQNVNKVSSKVELWFDLASTEALADEVKARLAAAAGSRLDTEGVLRLVSQETRDQRVNLSLARERLAELIRAALVRPKRRRPTKPSRGQRERRLDDKHRRGDVKRQRSTPPD